MEKLKRIWNIIFVPTSIKPIRFVLLIENIFCLYRNVDYYKKKCRVVIYLRIGTEIALTVLCIVCYTIYTYHSSIVPRKTSIVFYINETLSILIILLACYHSRKFKKLLLLIEENDKRFVNDDEYHKTLNRQDFIIKCGLLFCNLLECCAATMKYFRNHDSGLTHIILHVTYKLRGMICTCRCICEYITLYTVLNVMSEQIKCITRAVGKETINISGLHELDDLTVADHETSHKIKNYGELASVFSNIKECSKIFNTVFGLQLVLMLGSSTAYCIMFLYTMAFLSVKGYEDVNDLISNTMKLLIFFLLLLSLCHIGQKKQNNLTHLRRQLGRLLVKYVHDDVNYEATRDFLRLVSTRSVKTETLGAVNVDMTLIPSFIMFITSYTVIALQFNNIV